MKTATACILFCVAFATIAAAPQRKMAFESGDHIWVANIDGTAKKKLVVGDAPVLSPDGARIAFDSIPRSAYDNAAKGAPDPKRQITVLDIISGRLTPLKDIPGDNCLDPVWSPDGKWIAFEARRGSPGWISDLAVVKEDGTGFNIIKKGEKPLESGFNRLCWARDGRSIFYHDTKNIYRLGLDGVLLGQWEVDKIVPVDYLTSGGRIDVSPDGNRLLLTVDYRKNSDAPPPSLWSFDLTTQSAKHLNTPKELWIAEGCWLDNKNILFATGSPDDSAGAIYRMSIDGTNLKRLIKDARGVSVSSGD